MGDPFSLAFFIIVVEVLSRALNSRFYEPGYRCYEMPKWSENINQLDYAYDTIIFVSTEKYSLQMIMRILKVYENQSGQLINKNKSFLSTIKHLILTSW